MNLDVVVGVALLARQLHYRLRFDLQGRTAVRQQQYNPGKKVVRSQDWVVQKYRRQK
jgi:hypothetical protein